MQNFVVDQRLNGNNGLPELSEQFLEPSQGALQVASDEVADKAIDGFGV